MRYRWWWWLGAALGTAAIGFGLVGVLRHSGATQPFELARWTLGAAVVHDALLGPLVTAGGWLTVRALPVRVRAPARAGLALSALAVLLSWPYVRGYGRHASNPSALPFHYGRNLVVVLGVIWLGVVVSALLGRRT